MIKSNLKLKGIVAAVGLALAGTASAAVLQFNPSTGNSSFMFTSFDETTGHSYVSELTNGAGVLRLDGLLSLIAGGPFSQTYSLSGLSSNYSTSVFNNPIGGVRWGVVAADSTRSDVNNPTSAGARIIQTTPGDISDRLGQAVGNSTDNMTGLLGTLNASNACNASPCAATSAASPNYVGGASWSENWGLPGGLSNSQSVLNANASVLAMSLLAPDVSNPGLEDFVSLIQTPLSVNGAAVKATLNFASNTLTISGTAVPLPAAVWLLGSALVSTGALSRRKNSKA